MLAVSCNHIVSESMQAESLLQKSVNKRAKWVICTETTSLKGIPWKIKDGEFGVYSKVVAIPRYSLRSEVKYSRQEYDLQRWKKRNWCRFCIHHQGDDWGQLQNPVHRGNNSVLTHCSFQSTSTHQCATYPSMISEWQNQGLLPQAHTGPSPSGYQLKNELVDIGWVVHCCSNSLTWTPIDNSQMHYLTAPWLPWSGGERLIHNRPTYCVLFKDGEDPNWPLARQKQTSLAPTLTIEWVNRLI